MRVALFCLAGRKKGESAESASGAAEIFRLNAAQALALAGALRDGGRHEPLLVGEAGGFLEQGAKRWQLPYFTTSPLLPFRLWRWQAHAAHVLVQTVGQPSMQAGYKFFRLRKKGSATLAHAFFSAWPGEVAMRGKAMKRASHVLCGNSLIAGHIRQNCPHKPALAIDEPGIDLTRWRLAEPWQRNGRFVFGMGASLVANSGALLVIRAMSALWQRSDLPPWEVRMFGGGSRFREILGEAENLGVASRLSLLGEQPLWRVAALCHAWLLPGENTREAPCVTWAGCAAGIPALGVKSPLHEERLAQGASAAFLRVPSNDPQELARAMICLVKDEGLRQRLVAGGASLRPRIGLSAMASRTIDLYSSWLNYK